MAKKPPTREQETRSIMPADGVGATQPAGITCIDQWSIEGLGTFCDRLQNQDPDKAIEALRQHAVEAHLPLPAGRGMGEAFAWVVDVLRRRRLIKDWGEHPLSVDWLSLHVPPRGSASFALQN